MAGMTKARAELMADLQSVGLAVKDHVPEKVVPPLVIMGAKDPMLVPGITMSGLELTFNLGLLVLIPYKPNSEALKSLEETVEKVLFNTGGWDVVSVGSPVYMGFNDSQFPSMEIILSKTITIEGGI